MGLTHYLSQINNAQLAFSVKQQKPPNLDAAVTATLVEMKLFLPQKGMPLVHETDQSLIANTSYDSTAQMMKELLDRIKMLEIGLQEVKDPKPRQRP